MGWFGRKKATEVRVSVESEFVFADGRTMADIEREIRIREEDRRRFDELATYEGKSYFDWIPELDLLRAQKRDDEALAILLELIPIVESATTASYSTPWPHTPWAVERAAIILRRQKRLEEEIALLREHLWYDDGGKTLAIRLARAEVALAKNS